MMYRMYLRAARIVPALLLLACLGQATAAPPSPEQLFPATTTEFVAIPDVNRMTAAWQQTQFAQMLHDPALQPFLNDLFDRQKGFNYLLDSIGADFEIVKAATSGELGWAVVLASPTEVAHVLTLDMSGKTPQAQVLLNEMAKKLQQSGGTFERRTLDGGMASVVVSLPNNRQIVYGVKETMLIIGDHLPTVQGMLQRWVGAANNSLANLPAFRGVRRKSAVKNSETEMIRFYFEPVARTEAMLIYFPELKKKKGDNLAQALRKEGVDGIKGVGGTIAFVTNGTDTLLRAATYSPQPFRGAMRMATFVNNAPIMPDSWVPADISAYFTIGLDLVTAYDAFGTLFERLADEPPGAFNEIMEHVRVDKDGPQVDIRRDIIQQLQPRLTMINDFTKPIVEHSERYLFAVPVQNAEAERVLTLAIRKCFETDRRIKGREFAGAQIWEYQPKQKRANGKQAKVTLPGLCFTVARGQLFISTHASLLEKIIAYSGPTLAQSEDYRQFMREMARLGMGPSASRSFIRVEVAAESTYEMLRSNQLDKADTAVGLLLAKALADEKGKLRVDGRKLPPYSALAKYFGLAGSYLAVDPDGWTVIATVLKK